MGGAPPGGHTHDVGALGLEGVGAAGVEVRAVVALQEAHVVEAIGLGGVEKQLVKGVGAEGTHTHTGVPFNPPTAATAPVPPTWLFLPFWMHSAFLSMGASQEIWGKT